MNSGATTPTTAYSAMLTRESEDSDIYEARQEKDAPAMAGAPCQCVRERGSVPAPLGDDEWRQSAFLTMTEMVISDLGQAGRQG